MKEVTARATQKAVEELTSYLINSGAENYIEDHYTIRIDGGSETTAVITVQYTDKYSAHELRVKAEQERDRLRDALTKISTMQSHECTIGQNLKDAVRVACAALSPKP